MNLGQRYLGSKGVPEHKVEDGALGNLAPPADREESAWHHNSDLEQVMHANLHAKRGRDPTEGYGERARQSWLCQTYVWNGRLGLGPFTGMCNQR